MDSIFVYFYSKKKKKILQKFLSGNEQKVTSNEQKVTSNERVKSNEQRAKSNEQRATSEKFHLEFEYCKTALISKKLLGNN